MATLEDLNEYKEQLAGVRELLANDPDNEEYKMLEANCLEVIQLTESVLETSIPEERERKPILSPSQKRLSLSSLPPSRRSRQAVPLRDPSRSCRLLCRASLTFRKH